MPETTQLNEPRFRATLIRREDELTLEELLQRGLKAPGRGALLEVSFRAGKPFRARKGTGWSAVEVESSFGGKSVMLIEGGRVSGILRLKR